MYALGARTTIGRGSGCAIVLEGDRRGLETHAEIRFDGGRYRLVDLGSRNGVRLDDGQVRDAPLRDGQRIGLGRTVIAFHERRVEVPFAARLALLEKSELLRGLARGPLGWPARWIVRFYPKGGGDPAQGQPVAEPCCSSTRGRSGWRRSTRRGPSTSWRGSARAPASASGTCWAARAVATA